MPVLRKEVSSGVQKEIVRMAQEKQGEGYAYTYSEIAEVTGNGMTKDDISAICIHNGLRRKNRGKIKHSEDTILAEIKRLHEEVETGLRPSPSVRRSLMRPSEIRRLS